MLAGVSTVFGMLMAVLSTGCCCGSLCGGGGYRGGCGYTPQVDHCAPACPQPCNPCTPTYGGPLQGSYIAPTTTQAAGIPSVMQGLFHAMNHRLSGASPVVSRTVRTNLPDDRREALIMRFALGMDNREIARALGRTDGATKVLLHRAIRQLEELVKKAEGPTSPLV